MSRPRAKVGDQDFFEHAKQQQIERKRAALAERHRLMAEDGKGRGSQWRLERGRLAEIVDLIRHRHGGPVDTSDGVIYVEVAIPHLVERAGGFDPKGMLGKAEVYIRRWARIVTPLVTPDELEKAIAAARTRNRRRKLHWQAQTAGDRLFLSRAERKDLGIKTMRPAGMNEAEFEAYQRAEATAREQARRIRNGATPHSQSKAVQIRALASELGRSESTIKRRIASGELTLPLASQGGDPVSCRIEPKVLKLQNTDQVQAPGHTGLGPARLPQARRTRRAIGPSPGAKIIAVVTSPTVPLPLPGGEWSNQCDLFGPPSSLPETSPCRVSATPLAPAAALASLDGWYGGAMPAEALALISTITHARGLRSRASVAREMGLERQTLANAWHGRYGLGADKVALVKAWLVSHLREAA